MEIIKAAKNSISPWKAALCLLLCLTLVTACSLALPQGEAAVYNSVIRLHVLANSNSATDQALKLCVRDAILKAGCFDADKDISTAAAGISKGAEKAVSAANKVLAEAGVDYRATCCWGREQYPTRVYGQVRLPAGSYLSLRIVLGKGEGENWWCVLFPPLCLGAAGDFVNSKDGQVFSTKSKKYSLRFKLLELFFG